MKYIITGNEGDVTLTVVIDGSPHIVKGTNPDFLQILEAVREGDEAEAFRIISEGEKIENLTARLPQEVEIVDGTVYFRGLPMYSRLAEHILDAHRASRPFDHLVAFMKNIAKNPSRNSREQLYEFLDRHSFTITDDGHFIAFKGLRDDFTSIHSGPGIVNGREQSGHLDNSPGNILELPREDIVDNPGQGCAFGLHVGSREYAEGFHQGVLARVRVNPADVVSVPNDSDFQKVRVCRYVVIDNETMLDYQDDEELRSNMAEDILNNWKTPLTRWSTEVDDCYSVQGDDYHHDEESCDCGHMYDCAECGYFPGATPGLFEDPEFVFDIIFTSPSELARTYDYIFGPYADPEGVIEELVVTWREVQMKIGKTSLLVEWENYNARIPYRVQIMDTDEAKREAEAFRGRRRRRADVISLSDIFSQE